MVRVVWTRETTLLVEGDSLGEIEIAAKRAAEEGDLEDPEWEVPDPWQWERCEAVPDSLARWVGHAVNREGRIVPKEGGE